MMKWPFRKVILAGIVLVLASAVCRFGFLHPIGKETIISTSTLMDAIKIADLSTAEFTYRGIAPIYYDEQQTRLRCRICYSAVVKAGIDLDKMDDPVIDSEAKKVIIKLPEIELKVIITDEESMWVMPSNASVDLPEMRKISRADAEKEARKSDALIQTARENLESSLSGWLYPLLKQAGYTLEFE